MALTREQRFWAKVQKTDGCWLWARAKYPSGYGMASNWPGSPRAAHRVAWEMTNGPIPTGMLVCHRCDVRACVRPDHLFLGTQRDNMMDMAAKGRQAFQARPERVARGQRSGKSKLTDEQANEVRRRALAGENQSDIAAAFRISRQLVSEIKRGCVRRVAA